MDKDFTWSGYLRQIIEDYFTHNSCNFSFVKINVEWRVVVTK